MYPNVVCSMRIKSHSHIMELVTSNHYIVRWFSIFFTEKVKPSCITEMRDAKLTYSKIRHPELQGEGAIGMALEFEQAVKALDNHIQLLKQELHFAMTEESRPETTTQIITIKRELDKAVEERMKLVQIYSRPLVIPTTSIG